MKKIVLLALVAVMGLNAQVSAQITEGEPSAHKIRTGNRMEEGNWGLYMGVTSDMFKNWKDASIKNEISLPLLNVKYMYTDKWELRMGLQVDKTRTVAKGSIAKSYEKDGSIDDTYDVKDKAVKSSGLLTPGFAYHFSKNNILDVYAGAELPIGWTRDTQVSKNDDYTNRMRHGSFDIGVGTFVGLQLFIGHLPLALGVEYGLSSVTHCGNKYVNHVEGDGIDYTYKYRPNEDGSIESDVRYKNLRNRGTQIGSQFRLTLSYYFK